MQYAGCGGEEEQSYGCGAEWTWWDGYGEGCEEGAVSVKKE